MKHYLRTIILVLTIAGFSHATTYLKTWVNHAEADTMTQGDFFAWEYDVSVYGGSAEFQIYLDVDGSKTITAQDILLIEFEQTDGQTSSDGSPADSSSIEDGIIYSTLGVFGFAPGHYLLHAADLNDSSEKTAALTIFAPATVNVWFTGTLTKEDVAAPDQSLANIMIGAGTENQETGMWSGLTDENGQYIINLPDSAINEEWDIEIFFPTQITGYVANPCEYENVSVVNGANGPYDFELNLPKTYVYGDILDESLSVVVINDYGSIRNLDEDIESDFVFEDGHFTAYPVFGNDTTNVEFRLNIWGQYLIPDYLVPNTWYDPIYTFFLSIGDSVRKDFHVLATDTSIYVQVLKDSLPPQKEFTVRASNDSMGYTWTDSDTSGFASLRVRSGAPYWVSLQTEDDHGQSLLPEGYIVEGGNERQAQPGDTVCFNLVPPAGMIKGKLIYTSGDSTALNTDESQIRAYTIDGSSQYYSGIDPDSLTFQIHVPNDTFGVQFDNWDGNFLAKPVRRENVIVHSDTIDMINFEINYTHADMIIKLKGAPDNYYEQYQWWGINTEGEYPNIYETYTEANPDTTYCFRVCDGNWQIHAPYFGDNYTVTPQDTVITVSNDSTYFYLEIVYKINTGINTKQFIPKQFYVKPNYPNPFNPETTIEFGVSQKTKVQITVYDVNGRLITTLLNGSVNAGTHKIKWNAAQYASGMYIYKVAAEKQTITKKFILLK
jgi:hypothetical protein